MIDFSSQVKSGIKWGVMGQLSSQSLSIAISIVMARLLTPDIFGIVAMVTLITGFFSVLANVGFDYLLIQNDKMSQEAKSTIFWCNLFIALGLSALLFFSAPFLASFYEKDCVVLIAQTLSLTFLINAFGFIARTLLLKNLEVKFLSLSQVFAQLISGSAGIFLAITGHHLYALLAHKLLLSTIHSILLILKTRWMPSLILSMASIKVSWNKSLYFFIDKISVQIITHVDSFIVGKSLGAYDLGIYNKSYSFLMFPIRNFSVAIKNILFPSFSRYKGEIGKCRQMYLKLISSLSMLLLPMLVGFGLVADKVVLLALGNTWTDTVSLIRVFTALAFFQSIGSISRTILVSLEQTKRNFLVGLTGKILVIVSILVGLQWGLMGICISYTISGIIGIIYAQHVAQKEIQVTWNHFMKSVLPSIGVTLLATISSYLTHVVFSDKIDILTVLLLQISISTIVSLIVLEATKASAYMRLKALVLECKALIKY